MIRGLTDKTINAASFCYAQFSPPTPTRLNETVESGGVKCTLVVHFVQFMHE